MASSNDIQDMDMHEPNPFKASYDEMAEAEEEYTHTFGAEDDKSRLGDEAEFGDIGEDSPLLAGHGRVERNYEFNLVGCLWSAARCLLCCSSESPDFK
jgi:hypothetical protein